MSEEENKLRKALASEAPKLHWASSTTGKCWCGVSATPEHATQKNPPELKGALGEPAWRDG